MQEAHKSLSADKDIINITGALDQDQDPAEYLVIFVDPTWI